jgi:hypothetical protein
VFCLLSRKWRDISRLVKFGILALMDVKGTDGSNIMPCGPVGISRRLTTCFNLHIPDQFSQLLVAKVTNTIQERLHFFKKKITEIKFILSTSDPF